MEFFWGKKPKKVTGGIKAHARTFGNSWWSERWLQTLKDLHLDSRLARGRSYARKGQIVNVRIDTALISAQVQGTAKEPYEVQILFPQMPQGAREEILSAIRKRHDLSAHLMNNQVPPELEEIFRQNGVFLFPHAANELETSCSCPDWSNPCKHIAAVFYLISLELERDPFILLKVHGIEATVLKPKSAQIKMFERETQPLPTDANRFWKYTRRETGGHPDVEPVHLDSSPALLKQLGPFPLWRGDTDPLKFLEQVYNETSAAAKKMLKGV